MWFRKSLGKGNGIVLLSPEERQEVAMASREIRELVAEYTMGKADGKNVGKDQYAREDVVLLWAAKPAYDGYIVKIADNEDLVGAMTFVSTVPTLSVINLLPDKDYYWQVTSGEEVSEVRCFHTAKTVRTLKIEGVSNTRDLGGWTTEDGKWRIRYGMVYRGANLDNITDKGKDEMLNCLGVRTVLDLRTPGEGSAGAECPLGKGVNYILAGKTGGGYYWGNAFGINVYTEAMAREIRTFANPENYPIYVHCAVGRDRTGSLAFLLGALLGMNVRDLFLEYEMSFLSASAGGDGADVKTMMGIYLYMVDNVKAYAKSGNLAEAAAAFMMKELGITQQEIDAIKDIMLERVEK